MNLASGPDARLSRVSDVPPPPPGTPPPPPPGNLAPPPGYVAYGSAPTPLARVARVKGLSTAITIIIAIGGLSGVVNAILESGLRGQAEDFLGGTLSESEFEDSVIAFSAISALAGIALLAGAILVMIWMYRIAANLRAYGMNTTWHPLFAIFGWFLPPIVLYVIPFLMLRELWKMSKPASVTDAGSDGENPTLWLWFVCFGLLPLVALFVQFDQFGGNLTDTGNEAIAERLVDANVAFTLLSTVGTAIAAFAWILFARQLTARHIAMTGER